MKKSASLSLVSVWVALLIPLVLSSCEKGGGGGHSSGVPAAGLDVNGFWEGVLSDGSTAAGTLAQANASVTSSAKLGDMGQLVGTLNGYHMDFTFAHDSGGTESGQGDFSSDGMTFTGSLPSVGNFQLLWRGPDFEHHSPFGEPLEFSK